MLVACQGDQATGAGTQSTVAPAAGADCTACWHQRRDDETLVWTQRALDLDPTHLLANSLVAMVHWKRGDIVSVLEESLKRAPPGMSDGALTHLHQVVAEMRCAQACGGQRGLTREMFDAVNDPRLGFDPMLRLASRRATVYGDAGRLDDAFDCLDQAIASRDPSLMYLGVGPQCDRLRGDRRVNDCLKQMSLPATSCRPVESMRSRIALPRGVPSTVRLCRTTKRHSRSR
jgi:hypothetical protein